MTSKRKTTPQPAHIDTDRLPANVSWDKSGNGRWMLRYTEYKNGKPVKKNGRTVRKSKPLAGSNATLMEIYHAAGVDSPDGKVIPGGNTLKLLIEKYLDSLSFKRKQEGHAKSCRWGASLIEDVVDREVDMLFVDYHVDDFDRPALARLMGEMQEAEKPVTGIHKSFEFLRMMYNWARTQGHFDAASPCQGGKNGLELPAKKNQRYIPTKEEYQAVLNAAKDRAEIADRQPGSIPPYIWPALELAQTARLRLVEVTMLSDSDLLELPNPTDPTTTIKVLDCERVKGSEQTHVIMTPRMIEAVEYALAKRKQYWDKLGVPTPMKPEDRPLLIKPSDGKRMTEDAWHNAWHDFRTDLISKKIMSEGFGTGWSIHAMKHCGITWTEGDRAAKQAAGGHKSASMTMLYDHAIPLVRGLE